MTSEELDLHCKIAIAFEAITYPGDDNLVSPNSFGGLDPEREEIHEAFRGKHWKDITADFLSHNRQAIFFLSESGLLFFMPGYMSASICEFGDTLEATAELVNILTPSFGSQEAHEAAISSLSADDRRAISDTMEGVTLPSSEKCLGEFRRRFLRLSREQKSVIRDYLRYLRDNHPYEFGEDSASALNEFWEAQ